MTSKLIAARAKTHGDFANVARVSQNLRSFFREQPRHDDLTFEQAEALDGIATKIARILSGDPGFKDHWNDIAGYAELGGGGPIN